MQNYILCDFTCSSEKSELLIAELSQINFEGFIENENGFEAYLPESDFNQDDLNSILVQYEIDFTNVAIRKVAPQNWNANWEGSFEPVTIGTKLRIRAPFHEPSSDFSIELIIQPKTSFGTGHHETTYSIMELMLNFKMENLEVFDYGSGTGILAILASKLGAKTIFANDIDPWAAENIFENAELNQIENISFIQGDIQAAKSQTFDLILANINKNILMDSFTHLFPLLRENGHLIISGFYETDLPDLTSEAKKCGFNFKEKVTTNNWTAAVLTR
ncbi:MAG: 50S ribosomal protein L11 methyltransferase [Bacteroidia bacterium]|nr:50S ribosomal protein L11 methyltransferase [Bacteroidia bacterium]MCF8425736.1 50S ribosomal protein L11 methyltransferase [Bacteroidia bacterium]MCF8446392.1 50S ribosomal protein L11 methyltransferase [Bacteroidia bacterium]